MKKIISLILITSFVICVNVRASVNPITNSGFENATTGWTLMSPTYISTSTDFKQSGNSSLKISPPTSTTYVIQQTIPVVQGKKYILEFYSKISANDDYLDISNATFLVPGWRIVTISSDFMYHSFEFVASANNITLSIINNKNTSYYDDFNLREVVDLLVVNTSFNMSETDQYSIEFNEEINEDTIKDITVKTIVGSTLVDVDFGCTYSNKILVIDFNKKLPEYESYIVNLSSIKSVQGFGIAGEKVFTFEPGDPNAFRVITTLPSIVPIDVGIFQLDFSEPVNISTIDGNVEILSNGEPLGGSILINQDETDESKLFVRFGKFEMNQQYLLKLNNNILSNSGKNLIPKIYIFNTSGMIVDVNFEDELYTEDMPCPTSSPFYFMSSGVERNNSDVYIRREGSNKYASIKTGSLETYLGYKFTTPFTKTLIIDMKIRASNIIGGYDSDGRQVARISGADKNGSYGNRSNLGFTFNAQSDIFTFVDYGTKYTATQGKFMNVKIKFYKDEKNEYKATIYDDSNREIISFAPGYAGETPLTDISLVAFGLIYKAVGAAINDRIDIDDIKMYGIFEPNVMTTDIKETNFDVKTSRASIYFDEEMDISSLKNLKLKNLTTGEYERIDGVYDEVRRCFEIEFLDYLRYNSDYEIDLSKVLSKKLIAISKNIDFQTQKTMQYLSSMPTFNILANELNVVFTLKNSGEATTINTILVVKDADNNLKNVIVKPANIMANATYTSSDVKIDTSILENNDIISLYVLDFKFQPILTCNKMYTYGGAN